MPLIVPSMPRDSPGGNEPLVTEKSPGIGIPTPSTWVSCVLYAVPISPGGSVGGRMSPLHGTTGTTMSSWKMFFSRRVMSFLTETLGGSFVASQFTGLTANDALSDASTLKFGDVHGVTLASTPPTRATSGATSP